MSAEKTDRGRRRTDARQSTVFLASHLSRLASRRAIGAVLCLCAIGCSQVNRVEQVDRGEQADIDVFLHEHLPQQPVVTVGEAYRALLLVADGEEKYSTFQERESELLSRRWIRSDWRLCREQPIDNGAVAYTIIRMIHGERGLNSLIFGSLHLGDRRYALRDLVYMGLVDNAPSYRWITGGEMLDLMGRADDHMARHGLYPQEAVDLREELDAAATQPAGPDTQPAEHASQPG